MKKLNLESVKKFAAILMGVCILNSVSVFADQDLAESQNIDEYITLSRDVPLLENNQKTGEKTDIRLLFNIPVDALEDYYFIPHYSGYIEGKEKMCIFRFSLNNGKWRDRLSEREDAGDIRYLNNFYDHSDKYYWNINFKSMGPKDAVNKTDKHITCRLDSVKYYNQDTGDVIDGQYPLLFQAMGTGDVTMDVFVHVGEDNVPEDCEMRGYDPVDCGDDCFKYIGTITLAHIKGQTGQTTQTTTEQVTRAVTEQTTETATEQTTETTTEQTTEAVTEQTTKAIRNIEIPIGQSAYYLNGDEISMEGAAFISDGYTMLPLRATAGIVGAADKDITYDASTKTAFITCGDRQVSVGVGNRQIYVNGTELPVDSPAVIKDGRMYLPMRAVAEAFGIENISFDGVNKVVSIVD